MNIIHNSQVDYGILRRNSITRFFLSFFSMLILLIPFPLFGEVFFSPFEWDLGARERGDLIQQTVEITNSGDSPVQIELMATCDCFYPDVYEVSVPAGGKTEVNFTYDTKDDNGEFEKFIIIMTDDPDIPKALFRAWGQVPEGEAETAQKTSAQEEAGARDSESAYVIEYYYSPSCRSCIEFLEKKVPEVEEALGSTLNITTIDVLEGENFEDFQERMDQLGTGSKEFPVLVLGTIVLSGDKNIEKHFEEAAEAYIRGEPYQSQNNESTTATQEKLLVLPVVFAGLLDGINPCAFTTLIFLLAALALAGKSRREVLIIGIFFTLAVFITYSLIGFGFFKTLRLAGTFPVIAKIIRIILVGVLLVFAGISFYDYRIINRGDPNKIILQLPKAMKRRIHSSVRTYTRSGALIGSSIVMGFFVSVFELGCTGQVYFPTIAYLVQVEKQVLGYFLLFLYNLGFIMPLVIVFILTYTGVSSDKITGIFQKHMGKVKIGTGILFIGLAVLTLLT